MSARPPSSPNTAANTSGTRPEPEPGSRPAPAGQKPMRAGSGPRTMSADELLAMPVFPFGLAGAAAFFAALNLRRRQR